MASLRPLWPILVFVLANFALSAPVRALQPAIIFNANDGTVIFAEDADRLWHPASLTKLMTAYVTFDAIRSGLIGLHAETFPTYRARIQPKVRLGLNSKRALVIAEALGIVIARSANDVSVLIAEAVGGTVSHLGQWGRCIIDRAPFAKGHWGNGGPGGDGIERHVAHEFDHPSILRYSYGSPREEAEVRYERQCRYRAFVYHMNRTAKRLGMKRTVFHNPNGLPDIEQVTTARDMAILTHAIIRDFPEHAHYFSAIDLKVGNRELHTYNGFLKRYEGADGMKTGFVCASGYNIVTTATRDGVRLGAVVLGERSSIRRENRAAELLDFGFTRHAWVSLAKGETLSTLPTSGDVTQPPGDLTDGIRVCGGRSPPRVARRLYELPTGEDDEDEAEDEIATTDTSAQSTPSKSRTRPARTVRSTSSTPKKTSAVVAKTPASPSLAATRGFRAN